MRPILPKHVVGAEPRGVLSCGPKRALAQAISPTPTLTCVASLIELVRAHTDLDPEDVAWLQLLQADWQIIADLSFADLILWLPDRQGTGFWAGGQMRPTAGPTGEAGGIVGPLLPAGGRPPLP